MPWPEGLQNVAVILAALVGVVDQQANGCAGGAPLVHPAHDLNRVRFIALGHELAGAGAATIQIGLDVRLAQSQPRRAAVNHAADGWTVGFTEVGDCEKCAECIAAHGGGLSQTGIFSRALRQRGCSGLLRSASRGCKP